MKVKWGASKNKPLWENVRRIEWKERGNPKSEEWRNGVGMEKMGIDVLSC
jgi:hypothetical protein